jgi:RHH-type transcriptional regulator, proline utilization regulon repressor / proline dehydrogenase / delta 1-pyrroline-5-carboxylate dehydrogenase
MDFFSPALFEQDQYRTLNRAWRIDETAHLKRLINSAKLEDHAQARVQEHAYTLVEKVRKNRSSGTGIDAFMHEYKLSSQEGVVLMCLAEALLRIPDDETIDKLIRDKIATADWESHLGKSESLFVNASTWGLMISGRMVGGAEPLAANNPIGNLETSRGIFQRLLQRSGEPVIRQAVRQAMRIMGRQFVMGRTISEALKRARSQQAKGYLYSYDMLGEAARTEADSVRYLQAYLDAIKAIGKAAENRGPLQSPGISIKLSALHPRYELAQGERVMRKLLPRLLQLAQAARAVGIGLTIDAEEADRLDISMALFEAVATDATLSDWDGLGRTRCAQQAPPDDSAGEGCLLGYRNKTCSGARAGWLSGVYPQSLHGRVLSRLRTQTAGAKRAVLSAVRYSQCAYRGGCSGDGRRRAEGFRIPASAWHGSGAV